MLKTTEFAHLLIKENINSNDIVIDATCGNGFDTLFLANLVPDGKVIAYDIQEAAINNTKELTKDFNNIEYILGSHEFININNCKCVLFNLGYLPKGDKTITTKSNTTLNAIKNLINQFDKNPNMIIYLIIYPGHLEGSEESIILKEFTSNLDSKRYMVTLIEPFNQNNAPYLITINLKQKKTH
ncbi:MAG: class I SAM-dependent methyltransferase [Bacilli bacterium]|nr:class I SAM-dependent methyltransferase [Bacilli bacterium]